MKNQLLGVIKALVILSLLFFYSCSDDKNSTPPKIGSCSNGQETYTKSDIQIKFTKQEWSLQRNRMGGIDIYLKIAGSIRGDSAKIRTWGDGLTRDVKLILDKKNNFHQDCGILFSSKEMNKKYIETCTNIFIFKDKDTLKVELNSCPIPNLLYK